MLYPIFNQRMKYKNIFLTGSTGVVGKPLLKKLINEGHNVYALSRNKINDNYLISNNTEIKLQRNSINQILPKNTLDHIK